jgi:hypothetical protein
LPELTPTNIKTPPMVEISYHFLTINPCTGIDSEVILILIFAAMTLIFKVQRTKKSSKGGFVFDPNFG